jgi:hypothetical protein
MISAFDNMESYIKVSRTCTRLRMPGLVARSHVVMKHRTFGPALLVLRLCFPPFIHDDEVLRKYTIPPGRARLPCPG